jgi:Ca2+-binding EF-hand superfamily protein
MEANSDDFPEANITNVVQNLVTIALADTKSVRALFEAYDQDKTGFVGVDQAQSIFAGFLPKITKHAVLTLTRACDKGDKRYDYGLLLRFMRA